MVDNMQEKQKGKYIIGFLLLVILNTSVYIIMQDSGLKVDIQSTKTDFYVNDSNKWQLSGTEYVNLFDGTAKMRASSRNIITYTNDTSIIVKRVANYKDNISTIEYYIFDGTNKKIDKFPISHQIDVINGEGKILQYEITKLKYTGETISAITSPQSFGWNMKAEWSDENYYSRIYKYTGIDEGKLTIKYKVNSSNYTAYARFFDPPVTISANITPTIISDGDNVYGYCNATFTNTSRGVGYAYTWYKNGVLNSTGISTNGTCNQQQANVSSSCGGLNTGNYTIRTGGIYQDWTNRANAYDGDWNTYAESYNGFSNTVFDINYTIPANAIGATITIKHDRLTGQDASNSYGLTCLDYYSDVDFPHYSTMFSEDGTSEGLATTTYDISSTCISNHTGIKSLYNGVDPEKLQMQLWIYTNSGGPAYRVYEMNVSWQLSNYTNNTNALIATLPASETTPGDKWSFSCAAIDRYESSGYYNTSNITILTALIPNITLPANNSNVLTNYTTLNWSANKVLSNASFQLDNDAKNYSIYSSSTTYSTCYQETANANVSGCGLDTGSYTVGAANWAYTGTRLYDASWTNFDIGNPALASMYIVYMKPNSTVIGAKWQVMDAQSSTVNATTNLTIPSDCWSYSTTNVTFLVESDFGAFYSNWACQNATSTYKSLRSVYAYSRVNEEAIWWNISNTVITLSNITTRNLTSGVHNITLFLNSTVDGTQSANLTHYFNIRAGEVQNIIITSPANASTSQYRDNDLNWYTSVISSELDTCKYNYNGTNYTLKPDNSTCYQEQANVSETCGAKAFGIYNYSGTWDSGNYANLYDGNYANFNSVSSGTGIIYMNYSKPDGVVNATFQRKIESGTDGIETTNFTVTTSCLTPKFLQLRATIERFTETYDCYNGTDWVTFETSGFSEPTPTTYFYEEAVYWGIGDGTNKNTTIYNLSQANDYNVTVYCNDTFGRNFSNTSTFNVLLSPIKYNFDPVNNSVTSTTLIVFRTDVRASCKLNTTNSDYNTMVGTSDSVSLLHGLSIPTSSGVTDYYISCRNEANTSNDTTATNANIRYNIDTLGPSVVPSNFVNNSYFNNRSKVLNFTISDVSGVDYCLSYLYNRELTVLYADNFLVNCNYTNITDWGEGNKILNIWAYDTVGNVNNSYFYVGFNTIAPIINFTYPLNNSYNTNTTLKILTNITNTSNMTCYYTTDNAKDSYKYLDMPLNNTNYATNKTTDFSYSSVNGTLTNYMFNHGAITLKPQSSSFNGSTAKVTANISASKLGINTTVPVYSYAVWLKTPAYYPTTNKSGIFGTSYARVLNFNNGNNYIVFGIRNLTAAISVQSQCSYNYNSDYLIVGTMNGTTLTLYNNSVQCDQDAFTITNFVLNNELTSGFGGGLVLNGNQYLDSNFNYSIYNAMVFNKSLNQTEINSLYSAGKCAVSPVGDKLIAQYILCNQSEMTNVSLPYQESQFSNSTTVYDTNNFVQGRTNTSLAYKFDGNKSRKYVTLGVNSAINFSNTTPFTISAWFKASGPSKSTSGAGTIVSRYTANTGMRHYRLDIGDTNKRVGFSMWANGTNSTANVATSPTTVLNYSQWYYVTAVYDGINQSVYINGVKGATSVSTFCSIYCVYTDPVYIGAVKSSTTSPDAMFNGSISNVQFYNRTLTDTEILALYSGSVNDYVNPVSNNITTNCTNTTFDLFYISGRSNPFRLGQNNLTFYALDSASNIGTSYLRFYVDNTSLSVIMDSPANTTYATANVPLNFSANRDIQYINYTLNDGLVTQITGTNQTITVLSTGYNISLIFYDYYGNTYNTSVIFTSDTVGPNLINITPAINTRFSSLPFLLQFNLTETGACKWSLSPQSYTDMVETCTGTSDIDCSITGTIEGVQNIYVACVDAFGNGNLTYFTLPYNYDTTFPIINITTPANNSIYHYTSSVPLEFTYNEPVSTCMYSLDGAANVTIPQSYRYQEIANSSSATNVNLSDGYFEMSYKKPLDVTASQAHWQLAFNDVSLIFTNYTLPYTCFMASTDNVSVRVYYDTKVVDKSQYWTMSGAQILLQCYNGTGWEQITSLPFTVSYGNTYVENPPSRYNDTLTYTGGNAYYVNDWGYTFYPKGALIEEGLWWQYPTSSVISVPTEGNHNLTLTCTDITGLNGTSNLTNFSIDNSIVNVTILSPLNNSNQLKNTTMVLNWTVNTTVTWAGFQIDSLPINTSLYTTVPVNKTVDISTLPNANHTLRVFTNSSTNHNGSSGIYYFNTTGGPDVVSNVIVSSGSNYANSNYTGQCNVTDVDTQYVSFLYKWFINGVLYTNGTYGVGSSLLANVTRNVSVVNLYGYIHENDNVTFECTGFDGVKQSVPVNSTNITIINSPPIITQSYLIPSSIPESAMKVQLFCNATDPDNDTIMYYGQIYWEGNFNPFAWYAQSSYVQQGEVINVLNVTNTWLAYKFIYAQCKAKDATHAYTDYTTTTYYSNTTPVLTSSFNPSTPYARDTINASCNATDFDGDSIRYSWKLFRNGVLFDTGSDSNYYTNGLQVVSFVPYLFSVYDTITLECTAYDGVNTITGNVSTTIEAPVYINNVRISPTIINASSNLSAYCTGTQLDGLPIRYDYRWSVSSSDVRSSGTNSTYFTAGTEQLINVLDSTYINGNERIILECRGYDGTYYSTWKNVTSNLVSGIYLLLGGKGRSIIAETGSEITITAGNTDGTNTCVDINHLDYGTNYNCSTSQMNFTVDVSKNIVTNDSQGYSNLSLTYGTNGGSDTFNISSSSYDVPYNFTFNITPYTYDGEYPQDIEVYVGSVLTNVLGSFRIGNTELDEFDNGEKTPQLNFVTSGSKRYYFSMPKVANVTDAKLELSGDSNTNVDLGTGADGVFKFTTDHGSDSFGALTSPTDYTVSGNTIYLKLNRKYQFSNFTLGTGTTISTMDTSGAALYILVNGNSSVKGTVNLKGKVTPGYTGSTYTVDGTTITSPGVGNGGGSANGFGNGGAGGYAAYTTDWSRIVSECGGLATDTGANGGAGGAGSAIFGTPGASIYCYVTDGGRCATDGLAGTGSAGGSGGAYARTGNYVTYSDGSWYCWYAMAVYGSATSGSGGSSFGAAGTDCVASSGRTAPEGFGSWGAHCGGGGGAGGIAGIPGVHFYFKTKSLDITGASIDVSGTSGGNGGNGGKSSWGWGGIGGAGGGAGNSGNIYLYYTSLTGSPTSTTTNGGTGGASGQTYDTNSGTWFTSNSAGTNGYAGTYNAIGYLSLQNPNIKVGELNGTYDWNYTGTFNTTATATIKNSLVYALTNCTANEYGRCRIPIYFTSESLGLLDIDKISINYTYNPNPINVNASVVQTYLESCTGACNIPIVITSTNKGKLNISNIRYTYYGITQSFNVTVHNGTSSYGQRKDRTVSYKLSQYNYSLPGKLEYIDFYPPSGTSKGVQPFGQTGTIPIINVRNIGSEAFSFYIYLNNTHECVNLTASKTKVQSAGSVLSSTWYNVTNISAGASAGTWLWADYQCSYSTWKLYNPDFYYKACCSQCDVCSDEIN
jgi:hypothetical protein